MSLKIKALAGIALTMGCLSFTSVVYAGVNPVSKEHFFNAKVTSADILARLTNSNISLQKYLKTVESTEASSKEYFITRGKTASFDFYPASYEKTRHKILYYIPKNLKPKAPMMVLLHGGGGSTSTYESAASVAQMYLDDFTQFAEQTGTVIIAPSSSIGWGWQSNTFMVKELLALAGKELSVSLNNVLMFGHSMGAMGIIRNADTLVSRISSFISAAGGMPDWARSEMRLRTYFDTKVTHLQGLNDHFADFVDLSGKEQNAIQELSRKMKRPQTFDLKFNQGDHNYILTEVLNTLHTSQRSTRDLYRPYITGYLRAAHTDNTAPAVFKPELNEYFWLEAREYMASGRDSIVLVDGKIKNNVIDVRTQNLGMANNKGLKKLRVYLGGKLLDFSAPIKIYLNKKLAFNKVVKTDSLKLLETARYKQDPTFIFENYVDIDVNGESAELIYQGQNR